MSNEIYGRLVTGVGRGAKFIAMSVYAEIFKNLLNAEPFPGTLNLKIDKNDGILISKYFEKGKEFDNLINNGKPTGGIITNKFKLKINNDLIDAIGVRPLLTTHDNTIVEFVASIEIREKYEVEDGSKITIIF